MRLVIYKGVQYDADNLPAHVDAREAVPADEWFAQNRRPQPAKADAEPDEKPKKRRTRSSRDD